MWKVTATSIWSSKKPWTRKTTTLPCTRKCRIKNKVGIYHLINVEMKASWIMDTVDTYLSTVVFIVEEKLLFSDDIINKITVNFILHKHKKLISMIFSNFFINRRWIFFKILQTWCDSGNFPFVKGILCLTELWHICRIHNILLILQNNIHSLWLWTGLWQANDYDAEL